MGRENYAVVMILALKIFLSAVKAPTKPANVLRYRELRKEAKRKGKHFTEPFLFCGLKINFPLNVCWFRTELL